MLAFQKVRSFLFYLSLILFFGGLPFILFFALGYKFDPATFKLVRTGLIYVKTQPGGASIYLNNKLIPDKSPASIQELIPGVYKLKLELAQHYPWNGEVSVDAGKVSRLDKVILFTLTPDLEQLNQEKFSSFYLDAESGLIYYLNRKNDIVYRSNLEGSNFEDIASLPEDFSDIKEWGVSPDKTKLFIFSPRQIAVILFEGADNYGYSDSPVFLDYQRERIIQVYWHSDSYHLVVITNKHIGVIESRTGAVAVSLVDLNEENTASYYDNKHDILYFSDSQKSADGTIYNNLYRLKLNTDLYLLERLMKIKPSELLPSGGDTVRKEVPGE
ncbi:PEGA domain-containing protein [bacterium]|nr:MAG: PEGA domain-containing protein [bacterium]